MVNAMTIDVEDYFHVSAFEKISPPPSWQGRELRVERNAEKVLSILAEAGVKSTFFVLGWVADRCPDMIRRIAREGHEIASHGYGHRRVTTQQRAEFREDIRRSKHLLEDLIGTAVVGYRAPSYSISPRSLWAFDELVEAGYGYDSSVCPVRHDFYGMPSWPRFATSVRRLEDGCWEPEIPLAAAEAERGGHQGEKTAGKGLFILEAPISTLKIWKTNLPIAGGGYFRLYPYALTRWGMGRINRKEGAPVIFYLHPWEFDPDQPRMVGAGLKSRFRHYLNLEKTEKRFRKLLRDFRFQPLRAVVLDGPDVSADRVPGGVL
jgi:polysaccharide deacetylase family protein (PEP-CTERM system associated)